jgi:nucleobase:cation symporter-1, NCS1 family
VEFSRLPSGIPGLVALVVGFGVAIPFQNSSLGYSWGGPFNYVTANYLHGADLAYYVGFGVAFVVYWVLAGRSIRRSA